MLVVRLVTVPVAPPSTLSSAPVAALCERMRLASLTRDDEQMASVEKKAVGGGKGDEAEAMQFGGRA